jgi:DNA-directed RNA polymerase specialized sigma24 family protein
MILTEPDQFAAAFRAVEPWIRRLARRRVASSCDVEDLVQEIALRAWICRGQFTGRGTAEGWLIRISRTVIARRLHSAPPQRLNPLTRVSVLNHPTMTLTDIAPNSIAI